MFGHAGGLLAVISWVLLEGLSTCWCRWVVWFRSAGGLYFEVQLCGLIYRWAACSYRFFTASLPGTDGTKYVMGSFG